MENAIISLLCMALLIIGTLNVSAASLDSLDSISQSWKELDAQVMELRQTDIAAVSAEVSEEYEGSRVEVTVSNEGGISLADFEWWDVILRYQSGTEVWLPYEGGTPGWTLDGIYFDGSEEAIEPDILNPGETALIILELDTPVTQGEVNEVTISTPGGIVASIMFIWEAP